MEYYATYMERARKAIALAVAEPIPCLHLQFDVWTTPRTQEDLFGVYVIFIDKKMEPHAYLLAARQFRPTPELRSKGAEFLLKYLEDVAQQFGFDLLRHVLS